MRKEECSIANGQIKWTEYKAETVGELIEILLQFDSNMTLSVAECGISEAMTETASIKKFEKLSYLVIEGV